MKKLILMLFGLHGFFGLSAQVQTSTKMPFKGNVYDLFVAKVDEQSVSKFTVLENNLQTSHQTFLANLKKDSALFLLNAGTSNANCKPQGLYIVNSVQLQPVNLQNGTGNFFMKPNGALLFSDKDVIVCESSQIPTHTNVRLGFQSGPMLVHEGSINKNFGVGSSNKNIRSGVGTFSLNNEKYVVFAISSNPVTFYEFSELFTQKFNCLEALCLESVGCTMHFPSIKPANPLFNGIICNYICFKF